MMLKANSNYKIDIRELLNILDFDLVYTNSHCKLVDLLGANLGGIEDEIFERDKYIFSNLVDRLSRYIDDYIVESFLDCIDSNTSDFSYKEFYYLAKRIKRKRARDYFRTIFKALDEPDKYFTIKHIEV